EIPKLSDLLGLEHWGIAQTMGRLTQPKFELYARQAFLRVEQMADGSLVFEEPVKIGINVGDSGDEWRPVAYVCSIDLQGLVGPPLEVPWTDNGLGTGKPEVDALIRNFLGTLPLSSRLRPGQYRLIVGP
ncbi:MAG: hypothetical protein LBV12_07175, partial [Puniceicoccales bacterium]|nr:hypothetical protein [Puniceicoccales bacterium]